MKNGRIHIFRLGLFVIAGLVVLVVLLYTIGKNQNLFGNTFELRARFDNVNGLMPGNNVRFAGINAGTVKSIEVLNDTTVEVVMLTKTKMRSYIHKNAVASIGTDGLMGNKLINIVAAKTTAPPVDEGDILCTSKAANTDEMLKVLSQTNDDVAIIAAELKQALQRLNNSKALWAVLNDASLPAGLNASVANIKAASATLGQSMQTLNLIIGDVQAGRGSLGMMLKDTLLASEAGLALGRLKQAAIGADSLMNRLNLLAQTVAEDINHGQGTVNALLKDEEMKNSLYRDIRNIEEATHRFNQVMEAIQKSFLFRGYFKKQAAAAKK